MIHPEKHTRHEPFRDFWKRDRLCRELEQEYGLVIDNGRTKDNQRSLGEKAALLEAHTGQQSFESYAKAHRDKILHALEAAKDWQTLHEGLALYGMEIKLHGNGLAITDRHNQRHTVKASAVDRGLSLKNLERKFGKYLPAQRLEKLPGQSRYEAAPLHRSPERGALYTEFQQGIEKRKSVLAAAKEQEDITLPTIREKWAAKRRELEGKNIAKKNRRNLIALARKHEAEEIAAARLLHHAPREEICRKIPFASWNGFLQHKAGQGNEVALAILRSKGETTEPEREQQPEPVKDWSQHGKEQFSLNRAELRAEYAAKERAVLESENLSGKGKKQLLSVLRMEQIVQDVSTTIDRKGMVIFILSGGGRIMDVGKELFFSGNDRTARHVAMQYAQRKWGKALHVEGNKIVRLERELEKDHARKQQPGIER